MYQAMVSIVDFHCELLLKEALANILYTEAYYLHFLWSSKAVLTSLVDIIRMRMRRSTLEFLKYGSSYFCDLLKNARAMNFFQLLKYEKAMTFVAENCISACHLLHVFLHPRFV